MLWTCVSRDLVEAKAKETKRSTSSLSTITDSLSAESNCGTLNLHNTTDDYNQMETEEQFDTEHVPSGEGFHSKRITVRKIIHFLALLSTEGWGEGSNS